MLFLSCDNLNVGQVKRNCSQDLGKIQKQHTEQHACAKTVGQCYVGNSVVEPEPQGAASLGRSRNAKRLRRLRLR
jgi:hypothetical protein